jgi:hypothetical protein
MENLPRPFPEDEKVPSLQLLCASLMDITKLKSMNLDHLYLPPLNYKPPNELLVLSNDKTVMLYENFIDFKEDYCKLLKSKQLCNFKDLYIKINTQVEPVDYSERYKKYLSQRINCEYQTGSVYVNLEIYKTLKYVVLNTLDLSEVKSFLQNMMVLCDIVYDIYTTIIKESYVRKQVAYDIIKKYVNKKNEIEPYTRFLINIIERLCYENTIITSYLVKNQIIPLTISTVVKYLAPVAPSSLFLDFIKYEGFIKDSFLPYECYKDPEENIYILRCTE